MILLGDLAVISFACLVDFHTMFCFLPEFPCDVDIIGVLGVHPGFHGCDVLVFPSQTLSHGVVPDFVTGL